MSASRTIDVHAHIIEPETVRLLQNAAPAAGFRLEPIDDEFARFEFGGAGMTPFPRGAWDLERRLRDMDSNGFDLQVLSVCTQSFMAWRQNCASQSRKSRTIRLQPASRH
jgi:aminocarboxymuconate-semialdehyde decarboxylase